MVTESLIHLTATETQMRFLIVEDDRESADYLVKAFREVGYVADLASDGEEGLSLADSGDYDVLVFDRMLPKRDGLSLIGTLREKGNRTPALILSALGQVDDRIKGVRAGGATITCRNPIHSPNCWRGSRCCHAAMADRPRKLPIASAISSLIGCRIAWRAARKNSPCSRASFGCWNT